MNEIIKVCKIHGPLTEDKVLFNDKYPRCHQCKIDKDRRWKSNHKEQHIATSKRWKKENKEHYLEWQRKDREKDPEKYRKWSRELKSKNRVKYRKQELCRIHGLTHDEYDQLFKDHNNKCAICKREETRKRASGGIMPLTVDHCHKRERETGEHFVRGLLCHQCNLMIGYATDDLEILLSAVKYLKKYQ